MPERTSLLCLVALSSSFVGVAQDPLPAPQRSGEAIVAAFDAVRFPELDASRREDPEYRAEHERLREAAVKAQTELALELYRGQPDHPRMADLLRRRWTFLQHDLERPGEVRKETEDFVRDHPGHALVPDALAFQADTTGDLHHWSPEKCLPIVERLIEARPDHPRAPVFLFFIAEATPELDGREKLFRRISEQFTGSRYAEYAAGKLKQLQCLGKPFELAFEDAITGRRVSVQELSGTVVVIDFWATWCGPCVQEMPRLKELYEKYRSRGVEFIGVSLDVEQERGGLQHLKDYVRDHQIPWPQYYQGKKWGGFSTSWGINRIPALFVLDADGNLHDTNARRRLEEVLEKLIARK